MKPNNGRLPILGVTGGIGSGKSTVSKILKDAGAWIIDCDQISKALSLDVEVVQELKSVFGEEVVQEGKLNRKILASIVFEDKQKLQALNGIMHQKIAQRVERELESIRGNRLFVLDLPLPVREGFLEKCHRVWVVAATIEKRLERICRRDASTQEEVLKRINAQMTQEEYLKFADRVIYNEEDQQHLKGSVLNALDEFMET